VYHKGTAKGSPVRSIMLLALAGAGLSGIASAAWANTASASTNPASSASPTASPGYGGAASASPSASPAYSGTASASPSASPADSGLSAGSAGQQPYSCAVTVGVTTTSAQVPMQLATAGSGMVGSQHAVTLSAPVSALGTTFPDTATPMSVTGSAALEGQYAGSVPMTGLSDSGDGMFAMTGHWMPQTAGMVRVYAPHQFAARLRETTTSTAVTVACHATTATTTSTQVMVQVAASAAASPAVTGSATATSSAGAMPGAPNTGGGGSLHAPDELPLTAGGAGAVLAGLVVTGYALRRRRGVTR
jgi:hypothetical protein